MCIFELCGSASCKKKSNTESSFLLETLLNMWIVHKGGRKACIFDTSDIRYHDYQFETFCFYAKAWDLSIVRDPIGGCSSGRDPEFPRFIVSKQPFYGELKWHEDIAEILGIFYRKDDWWSQVNDRTCFRICVSGKRNMCLFVEMSRSPTESRDHANTLVNLWNFLIQSAVDFPDHLFLKKRPVLVLEEEFFSGDLVH